jgi:hypothetical protein
MEGKKKLHRGKSLLTSPWETEITPSDNVGSKRISKQVNAILDLIGTESYRIISISNWLDIITVFCQKGSISVYPWNFFLTSIYPHMQKLDAFITSVGLSRGVFFRILTLGHVQANPHHKLKVLRFAHLYSTLLFLSCLKNTL